MSDQTLKPCPFCGEANVICEPYGNVIGVPQEFAPNMWMVHCDENVVGCEASIVRRTADLAIAAWNTRATPTQAADDAEASSAELRAMKDIATAAMLAHQTDRIAALESEAERLRVEIERIADVTERWDDNLVSQVNEIARKALEPRA